MRPVPGNWKQKTNLKRLQKISTEHLHRCPPATLGVATSVVTTNCCLPHTVWSTYSHCGGSLALCRDFVGMFSSLPVCKQRVVSWGLACSLYYKWPLLSCSTCPFILTLNFYLQFSNLTFLILSSKHCSHSFKGSRCQFPSTLKTGQNHWRKSQVLLHSSRHLHTLIYSSVRVCLLRSIYTIFSLIFHHQPFDISPR